MQLDELPHVLHDGVGVPQLPQPFLRHASTHHLVMVERDALGRDLSGRGLADVVEQTRQPQHRIGLQPLDDRERVPQDVLVTVDRVLLELQRRELGEELLREPGLDQQRQPGTRRLAQQQLLELLPDALRRDDPEAFAHPLDRLDDTRHGRDTELRDEPSGPQHPQRVVRERDLGIERGVEALGREILHAFEGVDELTVRQPDGHRVDREVASRQIGLDVLREGDRRLAFVLRIPLLPEGGDLDQGAVAARPDRPEPHTDQVLSLRPAAEQTRGLRRQRRRSRNRSS